MLFLLRCVFWLSIVYASILLPKDEWHRLSDEAVHAGGVALESAAHQAVSGVVAGCSRHGSLCLTETARLTALIDATGPADHRDDGERTAKSDVPMMSIPVPVPRPHDVGGAKAERKP